MAYVGESSNIMRDQQGDSTISIPITFDYSGGRKDSKKGKMFWSIGVAILGMFVTAWYSFSRMEIFFLMSSSRVSFFIFMVLIRFVILREAGIGETNMFL